MTETYTGAMFAVGAGGFPGFQVYALMPHAYPWCKRCRSRQNGSAGVDRPRV